MEAVSDKMQLVRVNSHHPPLLNCTEAVNISKTIGLYLVQYCFYAMEYNLSQRLLNRLDIHLWRRPPCFEKLFPSNWIEEIIDD